ncbi:MAG TPA: alpha/beta fold hydrolase, partial [Candidatus Nanopelagicales bacterium]
RLGALLVNPGGPGRSGIAALDGSLTILDPAVRDHVDVVGLDPRGVGASAGVDCLDASQLEAWLHPDPAPDVMVPDGLRARVDQARRLVAPCAELDPADLAHLDTLTAARDLDIVRAALGDARLTYLGVSYGTTLGASYASLFPQRVGRLVLDAGVPPDLAPMARTEGLAAGFEGALAAFVRYCVASRPCPLGGSPAAALATLRAWLADLQVRPLPDSTDRALTGSHALAALLLGIADDETWPELATALTAAIDDRDPRAMLSLADRLDGRGAHGDPAAELAANVAITCADQSRPDLAALAAHGRRLAAASPTFGAHLLDAAILCAAWPAEGGPAAGMRAPARALASSPDARILVIGTTHDPAAPYPWSQALAADLGAALLTYDGYGHTAFGHSNACVSEAVSTLLLTGALPDEPARC